MSFDLWFWKQTKNCRHRAGTIVQRVCEGGELVGLTKLDLDAIKKRIAKAFKGFENNIYTTGQFYFTIDLYEPYAFQIVSSPPNDDEVVEMLNKIIDIAVDYKLTCYNPQVGKRYHLISKKAGRDSHFARKTTTATTTLAIWKRAPSVRTAMLSEAYEAICNNVGHEAMDTFDSVKLKKALVKEFGKQIMGKGEPFKLEFGSADNSTWALCHLPVGTRFDVIGRIVTIAMNQCLLIYDPQIEGVWGNRRR